MHIKFKLLLLTVAMLTVAARMTLPVAAQEAVGAIRGTVTDQSGAVIQKATVTVTNKATQSTRKVNAGDDGIYLVPNLLPGEYEVKVEAQGFATQVTTLTVQTGSTTPADAALRAGNVGEVVDVVAEAPIIDKQNYKIDGVITRQKIDALPLNGRNFLQLAALEPGVAVNAGNVGNANVLFSVSIGGGSSALTRLTVDGGSILDPVTGNAGQNFSTETIQEFQISTFNFDLSTGVTSMGAINIVSRTGTNDLHGNAFLYFRDHSFSALPTFNRPNSNFDPFFRRYQYGGAIGGPIKKDKAFFFGNIERLDQTSVIGTVVSGGFIPSLGIDIFRQFNNTFESTYEGWLVNARTDIKINEKNNLFGRFSYDNNRAFAPTGLNDMPSRWRNNKNRDPNAQVGNTTILTQNLVNDLRFNYQRITNESDIPSATECPASDPACIGLGGPEIIVAGAGANLTLGNNDAAPQSRFLDRYQTTDNINWVKGSHRLRFGGEWEHNYGHGTFGFAQPDVLVLHNPINVFATNAAVNAFLPAAIRPLYTIPLPASFSTGGNITYDDLFQLPLIFARVGFGNINQPQPFHEDIARQSNRYRFYGQDSWQIRPGLTFSYGLSYMYETNLQNHDLPKPALLKPLLGDIGNPKPDKNNFGPSIGFAWDVGNKGKTVVRGGAGFYYDTVLFFNRLGERALVGPAGNGRVLIGSEAFGNTIPFIRIPGIPEPLASINPAVGQSLNFLIIPTKFTGANFQTLAECSPVNSIGDCRFGSLAALLTQAQAKGLTGIDVFKATPPSAALSLLDPHLRTPYTQQFSVGFQRQMPGNMSLSMDFVIRQRRHALSEGGGSLFLQDYNLFNRSAARGGPKIPRCSAADAFSLTAQCSNGIIAVLTSSGREQYNALLVKLDKRFSNRMQFTASYAFSHLNGFYVTEDQTNWFGNPGPLDTDVHHRFSFSGVYQLPWNFQLSVIAIYASRPPFNARVGSTTDLNGDGTFGDTLPGLKIGTLGRDFGKSDLFRLVNSYNANLAGKPDGQGATIPMLTLPTKFEFGDDFWSQDIRLTKSVKLSERLQLQGFFEMFNIFNISNLTGFSSTIGSTFGRPTARVGQAFGTGGPRAIQFGGRFSF